MATKEKTPAATVEAGEEWEEELVIIDFPELCSSDPTYLLRTIKFDNWNTKQAKITLNESFSFDIMPEVVPGTPCFFSYVEDANKVPQAEFVASVSSETYVALMAARPKSTHVRPMDDLFAVNKLAEES